MLTNVHIKNIALIEDADIDLEKGLNIMTGETGSGKSIIINAINTALGSKADKGLIRTGSESGLVELLFVTDDEKTLNMLDELGISRDGCNVSVTRKITKDSTVSKINGENATLANIRKLTAGLIDIHGQHDHQSLLDADKHIDIIDTFGGESIAALKDAVRAEYDNYKKIRRSLLDYSMEPAELEKESVRLEREIEEIDNAALKEGEDKELEAEYKRIAGWEQISDFLYKAYSAINDENSGAAAQISLALSGINSAISISENTNGPDAGLSNSGEISGSGGGRVINSELRSVKNMLSDMEAISKDAGLEIERYINANELNKGRSEQVKERLDVIYKLKDKYGSTITEIFKYREEAGNKLFNLSGYEKKREDLLAGLERSKHELNRKAQELSAARREASDVLCSKITGALKDLNFPDVVFETEMTKLTKITANGFDRAEFMISMNPGELPKPLVKTASGGEISRIMLAIKSVTAEKDGIPTLIFDEIDTGISGNTAYKVSEKLEQLSRTHQIICITHLPQIAAMADHHFVIQKEVSDGTTISGIEKLSEDEEPQALARLLSGDRITDAALENARDLKERADRVKKGM